MCLRVCLPGRPRVTNCSKEKENDHRPRHKPVVHTKNTCVAPSSRTPANAPDPYAFRILSRSGMYIRYLDVIISLIVLWQSWRRYFPSGFHTRCDCRNTAGALHPRSNGATFGMNVSQHCTDRQPARLPVTTAERGHQMVNEELIQRGLQARHIVRTRARRRSRGIWPSSRTARHPNLTPTERLSASLPGDFEDHRDPGDTSTPTADDACNRHSGPA